METVPKTSKREEEAKDGARAYESNKIPIIASADAIVDPYTVVVLCLYAVVADPAMVTAWRPPDVASLAVFGRNIHRSSRGSG